MARARRLRNPRARILAAASVFSLLAVTSCGEAGHRIDPADLDPEHPFGFNWDSFDGKGTQIGENPSAECRTLISKLSNIIGPDERTRFEKICLKDKSTIIYVDDEVTQPWLRDAEISVEINGQSEPFAYSYRFLHRIAPDRLLNSLRRLWRAYQIRLAMAPDFGAPERTGYFGQAVETGFIADDGWDRPCGAWLRGNVGVVLCSERVVLEDGIEMALWFVRLDRAPNGRRLQCAIDPASAVGCGDEEEQTAISRSTTAVWALETLADWLGPDTFRHCQSDNLEPSEVRWTISDSDAAKLEHIVKSKFGDELAQYAIDYAGDSDLPNEGRENIALYLFKLAASQGSALAMNEIGASMLYCYLGVRQDIPAAKDWLEKAAAANDAIALQSLALMNLSNMTESPDRIWEAQRLLERCSLIDSRVCEKRLTALNVFVGIRDE